MKPKPKMALVIGWGSVKCTAALGLVRVLNKAGIAIDLIVTSGGGSIYGAMMAMGHSVDEIVAINQRLWTSEVTKIPNRRAIPQLLFPKLVDTDRYFNLRDDRLVNERLQTAFGDAKIEAGQTPLHIVATDYRNGQEVVFSEGSVFEAVRASIALPLVFAPIERGEQLLADGYLSEPLPIGVAIREQADIIIAMGFESVSNQPRHSIADYLLHLSSLMSQNLLRASAAFYSLAHHSELITIIPEFDDDIHIFDTDKIPEIIGVGEREGEKMLPHLLRLLEAQHDAE